MNDDSQSQALIAEIEATLAQFEAVRERLAQEAETLAERYWDHHWAHNPKLPLAEKTPMGVRVPRHPNNRAHFTIMWFWNRWVLTKRGKKQIISNYIPKGRTQLMYPTARLLQHARDWEADLILELESHFARIRHDVRELSSSERTLKRLLKRKHAELEAVAETDGSDTATPNTPNTPNPPDTPSEPAA